MIDKICGLEYKGVQFTDDRYTADNNSVNGTVNYLESTRQGVIDSGPKPTYFFLFLRIEIQ